MNAIQKQLLCKIKRLERKVLLGKLKRIVQKFLPISRKRHNQILEETRTTLRLAHEHQLQEAYKALDKLMPKLVRLSLSHDDGSTYNQMYKLQIFIHESMMRELNYSQQKEHIASAIGRMVEYEISRLHYVFPAR